MIFAPEDFSASPSPTRDRDTFVWTKRELIEDNEDLFELLGDICSYLEKSRVRLPIELCERIEEFLGPSDGLEDLASGDVIDVTPVDRSRAN